MVETSQELDVCGLSCPLPILRVKKTLNGMQSGETLKVVATDPGAVGDFEGFSLQTGNELLESYEADGIFHFIMKKA